MPAGVCYAIIWFLVMRLESAPAAKPVRARAAQVVEASLVTYLNIIQIIVSVALIALLLG